MEVNIQDKGSKVEMKERCFDSNTPQDYKKKVVLINSYPTNKGVHKIFGQEGGVLYFISIKHYF